MRMMPEICCYSPKYTRRTVGFTRAGSGRLLQPPHAHRPFSPLHSPAASGALLRPQPACRTPATGRLFCRTVRTAPEAIALDQWAALQCNDDLEQGRESTKQNLDTHTHHCSARPALLCTASWHTCILLIVLSGFVLQLWIFASESNLQQCVWGAFTLVLCICPLSIRERAAHESPPRVLMSSALSFEPNF